MLATLKKLRVKSGKMAPERVDRLIEELKAWIQKHHIRQYRVAAMLDISQSRLNDIIHKRRGGEPTGEQALRILELIQTTPEKRPEGK